MGWGRSSQRWNCTAPTCSIAAARSPLRCYRRSTPATLAAPTWGFGFNDRPNVTGDPSVSNKSPEQWFNTGAFSFPAFGTFGDAPRNMLQGPSYKNVNLALVKNMLFGTRSRLQLRAEAFNLFNRANFDLPDSFLGSPTFGHAPPPGAPVGSSSA